MVKLDEYQNEEYNGENEFIVLYLPCKIPRLMIKFYTETLSYTAQLWYKNITTFLLSQHVMPNIDIPIEIPHANLKYNSKIC